MAEDQMLDKLDRFYQSQGISALAFKCEHRDSCSSVCAPDKMISVPESYVGMEYETGTLPRLLFVSSDTNKPDWLDAHPEWGTLREIRTILWRDRNVPGRNPPQSHWHQTLALTGAILSPYAEERLGKPIPFNDLVGYIAHVRSTRCKDMSIGTKEGHPIMAINCRGYLKGEIEAMSPDIIVAQGKRAGNALWRSFPVVQRVPMPGNPHHKAYYEIVQLAESHHAIKIVAWHPCARGWRRGEKPAFMDWVASSVRDFIPTVQHR